jgi:glycogen debranching enzyme
LADIVRVADEYYVRASSALADDRTRVLKFGDTFAVFNRYGDIEQLGNSQFGLFHAEMRHLSCFAFLSVDLTNVDTNLNGSGTLPRGTVHLFRLQFLRDATCYEYIRLLNYGLDPIQVAVSIQFDADFADIFEVRGTKRERKGQRLPAHVEGDCAVLAYEGLDHVHRRTLVQFSPQAASLSPSEAQFRVSLAPKEEQTILCSITCQRDSVSRVIAPFHTAYTGIEREFHRTGIDECRIRTSSESFNNWLTRSAADLRMLIEGNPEGPYPYAGVPWFNTVFGRDGIITALECLWLAPRIAEGVLKHLAETQADAVIPELDAEPGKIIHEMRRGEMALTKEVPFAQYYGSVDSTPLFVILAAGYFLRTANLLLIRKIWPNVKRALQWIDEYGDFDRDGFVEYKQRSERGLVQQGWKDSQDSVFHADGRMAEPPIALCEVQAYVYAAKRSAALLARALLEQELSDRLEREAEALRVHFEEAFWSDELGMYVLALDGNKQQCRVRTSNAGQVLFSKIASEKHAEIVASSLMNEQLFSGWGIRTVGAWEARYNPMSYHNGSVWPHDNALIGLGFSLYGFQEKTCQLLEALFHVSRDVELQRLPELFCGFHKRADASGPTLYPVACAPQAWAAGAVYLLLRACIGITVRARDRQICFSKPTMPPSLQEVRIENLRLADAEVDLLIQRSKQGVALEVLRKQGEVEILETV